MRVRFRFQTTEDVPLADRFAVFLWSGLSFVSYYSDFFPERECAVPAVFRTRRGGDGQNLKFTKFKTGLCRFAKYTFDSICDGRLTS